MAMTPDLTPNLRMNPFELGEPESQAEDVIVEVIENGETPTFDSDGNIIEIKHGDGSVTISLDGKPIKENRKKRDTESWFRNLAEEIDENDLRAIASDLIRGIEEDLESRKDWVESRSQGVKLLGLKIEIPNVAGASDGAPVEGMSKVRHPLLLEAVLRFQANARAEMLPTDGPVKIRNDNNNASLQEDQTANSFQRDMNHYLTVTASEYYPDTDRMLLMLGFGGTAFKKVYFCPLRGRPVSESVDADDLIVNNNATDLQNAKRITHRTFMRPSTVKRLQILGVYKDIPLSTPKARDPDSYKREKNAQQGIASDDGRPEDRDREIYECYCELDIPGFEHSWKGKDTGLEIPYRVTIDVSSKEVLSIVRNYDEDTAQLPEARQNFVKYTFVPGMGFYDIGLLHILGNTTNAITAAWRELLDAGMYNNFPGFLMADTGARQNTNIFRVPPGGGALVKTGGMPITQAIMPLPYKEPSGALMNLVNNMAETGMRVGGTSEAAVTEGKQDAPVGTTLAMIEQAQKVLNSVHKRMHQAQSQEFTLLVRCFQENPESFWQKNRRPAMPWDEQTFLQALNDIELTPQADPNTASQTQRLMKVAALKQLSAASPALYDPIAVDTAALQALGWTNPSQFLAPQTGAPPPEMIQMQAKMQNEAMSAQSRMLDSQTRAKQGEADAALAMARAKEVLAKAGGDNQNGQPSIQDQIKMQEMQLQREDMQQKQQDSILDAINRKRDRESRERLAAMKFAEDAMQNPQGLAVAQHLVPQEMLNRLENQEEPLHQNPLQEIK
jgi:hypothetical protein